MKVIVFIIGAALGFGGGVWWGVNNPIQAASLSAQEQAEFVRTAEAAKDKIDAMAAKQQTSSGGTASPTPAGAGTDPDLVSLSRQMKQQLDSMKAKIHP